jgi:hypothetical protein
MASVPELALGLQGKTPGQEAQAFLTYCETGQPAYQAYASGRSLTFMARDVNEHRRLAQFFASVVYPEP